jgi:hypothetical protein
VPKGTASRDPDPQESAPELPVAASTARQVSTTSGFHSRRRRSDAPPDAPPDAPSEGETGGTGNGEAGDVGDPRAPFGRHEAPTVPRGRANTVASEPPPSKRRRARRESDLPHAEVDEVVADLSKDPRRERD